MNHLVLLHGMGANSKDQWLPYTEAHFEDLGWKVDAPDIPNSDQPDLERWISYINENVNLTNDTVLVGHSMGCPVILSLLERSSVHISKAILVAGFIESIADVVEPILQAEYDWKKIKENCDNFYFINSDNDPYTCDDKQGRLIFDKLGGTQIIMSGEGHFGTTEFSQPYKEFPFLLKLIAT